MKAVLRRDVRAYFTSPTGYIYIGAYIFVLNLFFYIENILGASSSLADLFSFMLTMMIFLTPILTMRVFSEEYKQKTDQFLFTSPISLFSIVLGKFLSSFIVFLTMLLFTAFWPLIISIFTGVNSAEVFGNYSGIILIGAAYISIGVFISSLTENQVIAAVGTLGLFLALFILERLALIFYDSGVLPVFIMRFLLFISIFGRYNEITRGLLGLDSLIFFSSACVLFIFLTVLVLETKRHGKFVLAKRLKFTGYRIAVTVTFIAVITLLNVFAGILTERYFLKADLTEGGLYSISERAEEFLHEMTGQVDVVVLAEESVWYSNPTFSLVANILQNYSAASGGNIKVQYVDPDLNYFDGPRYNNSLITLKASYTELSEMQRGDILFISSQRATRLFVADLFVQGFDDFGRPSLTAIRADRELVSALLYVTNEQISRVTFINNHQENPSEYIRQVFERSGYVSSSINLALEDIPDDTALLVSAGPKLAFLSDEVIKIERYLATGGNVVILYDFNVQTLPGLDEFLAAWGVEVEHKIIFDEDYNFVPQIGIIGAKVVSGKLPSTVNAEIYTTTNAPVGVYRARPLRALWTGGSRDNYQMYPYIQTFSGSSYARDLSEGLTGSTERTNNDETGPFTLAWHTSFLTADNEGNQVHGNLIVTSADIFDDDFLAVYSEVFYNAHLIIDLAGDFNPAGESVRILSKSVISAPMLVSSGSARTILVLLVIMMPLLIFTAGVVIWRKRRNQ